MKRRSLIAGFTLLEMLAVMLVMGLLASGYYGPQLLAETRRIKRIQADVMAQEISLLIAAAQAHSLAHAGEWPRQHHDCRRAHEALTARLPSEAFSRDSAFYRGPAPSHAPSFTPGGEPLHLGRYYFDCGRTADGTRPLFRVRMVLGEDTVTWAEYIANQLPNSVVGGGTTLRSVEVAAPQLAVLPAFDAFVVKDDPVFEADLDVEGNSIFDVGDVILDSGQTLASALQYAGIAVPGNYVNKPDCPLGLTPQVITVPLEVSHEELQPITYFRTYANDLGSAWQISSEVYGMRSEAAAPRMRVSVFTLCA